MLGFLRRKSSGHGGSRHSSPGRRGNMISNLMSRGSHASRHSNHSNGNADSNNDDGEDSHNRWRGGDITLRQSSSVSCSSHGRLRRRRHPGRMQKRTSKTSHGSSTALMSDEFSLPPSVASYPRSLRSSFRRSRSAQLGGLGPAHHHQQQQQPDGSEAAASPSSALQPFITRMCSSIPILMDDSHRYALHRKGSEFSNGNNANLHTATSLDLTSKTNPSIMATMSRLPNIDDVFTIQDTVENEDTTSSASVIVFRQIHCAASYRYKVYAVRPLWQGQSTSARYPNFYFWGHVVVTKTTAAADNSNKQDNCMSLLEEEEEDHQSSSSLSSSSNSNNNKAQAPMIGASYTNVIWMLHEAGVPESRIRNPTKDNVSTRYTSKQQYQQIHSSNMKRRKSKWTTIQKHHNNENKSRSTCARIIHYDDERELIVRPGQDAGLVLCFIGILDDLERLDI
eukprot:CAMPEP_0119554608 /NCGR_PEP_ID=MMETSP1352-20130426/7049_1 /TAXON_ID=265584 /ORGANISM="Stauroneis constricta, Strain CCMP1120" /LENGTH=451 /DNA_ID=CAMNT_0007601223 /DNA_START=110 /DNA_END=1465 /DNA_ORIENTATION=-